MNDKRITLGILTWFLGISVPIYNHSTVFTAFSTRSVLTTVDIRNVFESLPWINWLYLILMTAVGGLLIVSGILEARVKTTPLPTEAGIAPATAADPASNS